MFNMQIFSEILFHGKLKNFFSSLYLKILFCSIAFLEGTDSVFLLFHASDLQYIECVSIVVMLWVLTVKSV